MPGFADVGLNGTNAALLSRKGGSHIVLHGRWKHLIPAMQRTIYENVVRELRERGVEFAFGGAFGLATYTGKWRDTKDMDVYIRPFDRDRVVDALTACGLTDYYDIRDYDRAWIYRSHRDNVIVDAIWAMANQRAQVDDEWISRGPLTDFGGMTVRILPPEELIWAKLYVLQRDRCDWPDILNIINAVGPAIDWERLVARVEPDFPVLDGVLSIFRWMSPRRARELPSWLWTLRDRPGSLEEDAEHDRRVRLLDTRPWFHEIPGDTES